MRVNIVIILNVIFVIGGRNKKRVKINHIHAKFFQIIHLFQNSLQIASVEFPHSHSRRIFIPVLHPLRLSVYIFIL